MKTTFQLDQYKVEFDVPDGSTRKGNKEEQHKGLITFPGENPAVVSGEILEGYTRIDDINRNHFMFDLAKKPSVLNQDAAFSTMAANLKGVRISARGIPLKKVVVKGHNGLHLKIGDHGYTAERFLIWLADDVVFDMHFFYKDYIEPIRSITESISFSTSEE